MTRRTALLLFSTILAFPLFASGIAGRDLIIPIAARAPGAFGSAWRTDLVISNLGDEEVHVGIAFMNEQIREVSTKSLRPGQTIVLKDVLREHFHFDAAHGWIQVSAARPDGVITASARIYNIAASAATADYGTQIPAFPIVSLGQRVSLEGLNGSGGNRTNVGLTNPNAFDEATVSLTLRDTTGDVRATSSLAVKPAGLSMLNDIFTVMGVAPFDGARLDVQSSLPLYAFASNVNASGDSDFIAGAARDRAVSDIVAPSCAEPASLGVAPHSRGGWIVVFHDGTDATVRTAALETKYGFKARHVYTNALSGFSTQKSLTPATVAALRCEADVGLMEQDAVGHILSH